jgi:hypothetical protein
MLLWSDKILVTVVVVIAETDAEVDMDDVDI